MYATLPFEINVSFHDRAVDNMVNSRVAPTVLPSVTDGTTESMLRTIDILLAGNARVRKSFDLRWTAASIA